MTNGKNAVCRVCGDAGPKKFYKVREMMFGLKDEFDYFQCGSCGCLQIADIPRDMSRYYPPEYYSFRIPELVKKGFRDNPIKRYLRHKRTAYLLGRKGVVGRLVSAIKPAEKALAGYLEWFRTCSAGLDSKILDVGCGKGKLLLELSWCGFKDLTGIDPYIERDMTYDNGVRILKRDLGGVEGGYDVVMFHHSFEHMEDPVSVLQKAGRLLKPGGRVLIRIPTVSSYAWKNYGTDWVAIDAPRHFFLHSIESIRLTADKAGLRVKEIFFDSNDFQFWGSEQYRRSIPLFDEKSYYLDTEKGVFSRAEIGVFAARADELNKEGMGDTVCIYMEKNKDEFQPAGS